MRRASLCALSALVGSIVATLGPTGIVGSPALAIKDGNITIYYVTVGKENNEFIPNDIVANPGDIVSFQFYPSNHSVIRSRYGWPCIPVEETPPPHVSPFFSGFFPVEDALEKPPTWNLTVNTTDPMWFYCGAPGSCIDWGMLGVINAAEDTSITTQISLAREAKVMLEPGEEFPTEQAEASFSRLAHIATITTASVKSRTAGEPTAATTTSMRMKMEMEHDKSSGIPQPTVIGVAVGVASAVLIIVALLFLLNRTRHLKRKLARERAALSRGTWNGTNMSDATPFHVGTEHAGEMSPNRSRYYSPILKPEHWTTSWPASETLGVSRPWHRSVDASRLNLEHAPLDFQVHSSELRSSTLTRQEMDVPSNDSHEMGI